jgi:hypothetical protein
MVRQLRKRTFVSITQPIVDPSNAVREIGIGHYRIQHFLSGLCRILPSFFLTETHTYFFCSINLVRDRFPPSTYGFNHSFGRLYVESYFSGLT